MKNKIEIEGIEPHLTRSNNNVVNRDKDELDEKPYESHNHESDRCTKRYLCKFWNKQKKTNLSIRILIDQQNLKIAKDKKEKWVTFAIGLVASLDKTNTVLSELS